VTSTTYDGNLGGVTGADSKCQTRANAVGLGGTYKAWLSSGTGGSPSTRLSKAGGPYRLPVSLTTIANNWAQLTSGTLQHAISGTESGGATPTMTTPGGYAPFCSSISGKAFWSDTLDTGAMYYDGAACGNWDSTSATQAAFGSSTLSTSWSTACITSTGGGGVCAALAALLCIQQ
jgi:hypothetical protein